MNGLAGSRWLEGVLALVGATSIALAPTAAADPGDGGYNADPGDPGYNGAPTVRSGRPVPTMNGVPCVGGKLGTCVGFAQNSPDRPPPRSTVGHPAIAGD